MYVHMCMLAKIVIVFICYEKDDGIFLLLALGLFPSQRVLSHFTICIYFLFSVDTLPISFLSLYLSLSLLSVFFSLHFWSVYFFPLIVYFSLFFSFAWIYKFVLDRYIYINLFFIQMHILKENKKGNGDSLIAIYMYYNC